MTKPDPAPPAGVDVRTPSVARVYDYYLGGTANWAIDRELGDGVLAKFPLVKDVALGNRLFLNRVVRHLTKLGVRQFLDVGSGVPTRGNTHEVADELARAQGRPPDTRVVYVDNEAIAVAHSEVLLDKEGDADRHAVLHADLREPDDVWRRALATGLIDEHEPLALLLIAVLHVHQPDADGTDITARSVARFRELLPVGSYLAVTHMTVDGVPPEVGEGFGELRRQFDAVIRNRTVWRTRAEIVEFLGDFAMLPPGWTWTPEWHPEETGPTAPDMELTTPSAAALWAGVGRKTERTA